MLQPLQRQAPIRPVRVNSQMQLVGLRQTRRPLYIENERGAFYVGHGAHQFGRPVQNLDFDRLTGSPEMLALFHGALTLYLKR